jgi:hypothetical protein
MIEMVKGNVENQYKLSEEIRSAFEVGYLKPNQGVTPTALSASFYRTTEAVIPNSLTGKQ